MLEGLALLSKSFIRLSAEGEPQLLSISPVIKSNGALDREHVAVFLDEDGPHIMAFADLPELLALSECIPLEAMTHWKSRVH